MIKKIIGAFVAAFFMAAPVQAACYMSVQHNILGQAQFNGSESITPGTSYARCCTAWTSQTVFLGFKYTPQAPIYKAWLYVIWTPQSSNILAQLRSQGNGTLYDDNVGTITATPTGGPIPQVLDITAQMQAMQAAGEATNTSKTFGMYFKGDGVSSARVYDVHLEMVYDTCPAS